MATLEVSNRCQIHGRWLEPGTEVHVHGMAGRYVFQRHVRNVDTGAEWLDFLGPHGARSFRPARIKTVHRTRKERQS